MPCKKTPIYDYDIFVRTGMVDLYLVRLLTCMAWYNSRLLLRRVGAGCHSSPQRREKSVIAKNEAILMQHIHNVSYVFIQYQPIKI